MISGGLVAEPQLDLSFRHHPVRGTWVDRRLFRWPYTLSRSFRQTGDELMLILQTASGAIQADDRLVQRIHVGQDAAVHIATQGAMPVHRVRAGVAARDEITLDIADRGSIAYMPDLRILFPDSSLSQHVRIRLAESAVAVFADGFVMHDPVGKDRPFREYHTEFRVERPDGELLALDRTSLLSPHRSSGKRASYVAFGTLMVTVGRPAAWLHVLCAEIDVRLARLPDLYSATSLLPNNAGLSVRIAARDGRHLRLGLQAGWHAARLHVSNHEASPRGFLLLNSNYEASGSPVIQSGNVA